MEEFYINNQVQDIDFSKGEKAAKKSYGFGLAALIACLTRMVVGISIFTLPAFFEHTSPFHHVHFILPYVYCLVGLLPIPLVIISLCCYLKSKKVYGNPTHRRAKTGLAFSVISLASTVCVAFFLGGIILLGSMLFAAG